MSNPNRSFPNNSNNPNGDRAPPNGQPNNQNPKPPQPKKKNYPWNNKYQNFNKNKKKDSTNPQQPKPPSDPPPLPLPPSPSPHLSNFPKQSLPNQNLSTIFKNMLSPLPSQPGDYHELHQPSPSPKRHPSHSTSRTPANTSLTVDHTSHFIIKEKKIEDIKIFLKKYDKTYLDQKKIRISDIFSNWPYYFNEKTPEYNVKN
jgi:hypothetical protein